MCSVSYLPNPEGGFILTSNRDELILRQALSPRKYRYRDTDIIFPKDSQVLGSWIACSDHRAVCLLNGAKEAHEHKPPYRKSRGGVLLDLLVEKNIHDFHKNYDLTDIEPFTTVYVDMNHTKLYELIWDGKYADLNELDPMKGYFWSSSTLYDGAWRKLREKWFNEFIQKQPNSKPEDALKFHMEGGEGKGEYDLVMSRKGGQLRTISITQITHVQSCRMYHRDLLNQEETSLQF